MEQHQVKGNKVSGYDDCQNPGDFYFAADDEALIYMCPCPQNCKRHGSLPLKKTREEKAAHSQSWLWDGNHETPTLEPSIRRLDGCMWHGFLQKGVWKTV